MINHLYEGGRALRPEQIEQIEIDLLLEAIYRRYGYDFRSYARASIERRLRGFMSREQCPSIPAAIERLLREQDFFTGMVQSFSVAVTEMFRDPWVYRILREKVLPMLKTWPHFKIWHAGCASGEEAYSLAIMLKELGVYHRATIYATDFNDAVLDQAREGIYHLGRIQEATKNYQQSGGTGSFSNYYHARYGSAAMDPSLRERIVFSNHNLATDSVFSETHLVFCRNVLIYFDRNLQNRSLKLFSDSLVRGGFLCLGTKENLQFTEAADLFEAVAPKVRIYKKVAGT